MTKNPDINYSAEQDNSPPLMISVDELNSEGYELPGEQVIDNDQNMPGMVSVKISDEHLEIMEEKINMIEELTAEQTDVEQLKKMEQMRENAHEQTINLRYKEE